MVKMHNDMAALATVSESALNIFLNARNTAIVNSIPSLVNTGRSLWDAANWYNSYKSLQDQVVKDTRKDRVWQKVGLLKHSPAQKLKDTAIQNSSGIGWANGLAVAINLIPLGINVASVVIDHVEAKKWDKGEFVILA
jgi:hypothetical protein